MHSDAASHGGDGCALARRTKKVCSRVSRTSYAMTGHGSFGQHGYVSERSSAEMLPTCHSAYL